MISMRTFYKTGAILFGIALIANLWKLIIEWDLMNLATKISFIAMSVLFQALLLVLFVGLWKSTPDLTIENDGLNDLLNKYGGIENEEEATTI